MRHRIADKKFNRDSNARKALLKALAIALFEQGKITTTQAKAKVLKRLADKLISRAQKGQMADRRILHRFFGKRDVVNTLVDRIAPSMMDRTSGFTRIAVEGSRRGDNTTVASISLIVTPMIKGLKAPTTAVKSETTSQVVKAEIKVASTEKKAPKKTAAKKTDTKEVASTAKAAKATTKKAK